MSYPKEGGNNFFGPGDTTLMRFGAAASQREFREPRLTVWGFGPWILGLGV